MKTFIYALCDPITEEIRYIGKTNTPRKRYYAHLNESKIGKKKSHKISWIRLLFSINQKPLLKIISEVESEDWKYWETYYIEFYRSSGCNLTNLTEGGQGGNGHSHSVESKQKMSASKKGVKLSEEHKQKISEKVKEKSQENPGYNRNGNNVKKSIERDLLYQLYIIENLSIPKIAERLKCSETMIFRNLKECEIKKEKSNWIKHLSTNPKKTVLQYDLEGNLLKEWEGAIDVKKELNIDVNGCCVGRQKTSGGFIWRYKDEWFDLNLDKLDENSKKVSQYDLNGNWIRDFDSMFQASEITGINHGNIGECCREKYKSAGKYIWRYYGDNPPKKYKNKVLKPVLQYDLSGNLIAEFDSLVEAAKSTGSRENCIQMCCVGKYRHSNGYVWKYKIY
jgi:hypothetical protein